MYDEHGTGTKQNILSGLYAVESMAPLSELVDKCKAVETGSFGWTLTDGEKLSSCATRMETCSNQMHEQQDPYCTCRISPRPQMPHV